MLFYTHNMSFDVWEVRFVSNMELLTVTPTEEKAKQIINGITSPQQIVVNVLTAY